MTTTKKTILIVFLILCIAFTAVASVLAIPQNVVQASAAEEEITYHYYEYFLYTLPFPMNEISNIDHYENTLTGKESDGVLYKLFSLDVYETIKDGKRNVNKLLGNVQLKVTIDYDVGYCFYPRTENDISVNWRNDTDWATYQNDKGQLYGVMSTEINSEEAIYGDKTYSLKFQSLHAIEKISIKVTDLFTQQSIMTTTIDENHVDISQEWYETSATRDANVPLFINDVDTGLSFQSGYDIGFADGEIEGEKNANATNDSYQLGYKTGYDVGLDEGYKKGTYDVDVLLSETTGTAIGSITDTIMKFLSFEVAGISMWAILAIIGGIIVTGIIIKLVI